MSTQLGQVPPSDVAPGFGMSFPLGGVVRESLSELRASWYWFVILGPALMVLGILARRLPV